jgi:hypothetical protein
MLKYHGHHPAYHWWCLAGKTFGVWWYILGSQTRCVSHWVLQYREHTLGGVGWWTEDDTVWDGCGQLSGESPQLCHSRQSNKKTSKGVALASHLAACCLGYGPSPVAIWPRYNDIGKSLKVQTENNRYQGTLSHSIPACDICHLVATDTYMAWCSC